MTRKEGSLSRRDFMKATLLGLGGLFVATNFPDWFNNNEYSDWFKEGIWDYADAFVRTNIPEKRIQLQVLPVVQSLPYDVTLSHINVPAENWSIAQPPPFGGTLGHTDSLVNLYEGASPNKAIFEAVKYLQEHASKEIHPPYSSGFIGVAVASMYPEHVLARKASSIDREKLLAKANPNEYPSVNFDTDGSFTWSIPGSHGGDGHIIAVSTTEPLSFVSTQTSDQGIIMGMTPRQWTQSTTHKPITKSLCTNSYLGVPLEHTCPSAWIAATDTGHVGMAGSYANLTTFSYAPQVVSNIDLGVLERNIITTPSPFTLPGQRISRAEATILAGMPEKGFNQWKIPYPHLTYSTGSFGDTVVYNTTTGLFRFINKNERVETISSLNPDEIWATPGETFPTEGPNYYQDVDIFGTKWDPTLNGMMLVPEQEGFRPVAFITTDQNKRFSLFQAQEMVQTIGRQMKVPAGSAFVNWDRHGAGGLYLTA